MMVKPFQFARVPKIYFKNGILSQLPVIAGLYGRSIIVVTGKSSFIRTKQSEKLFHEFEKEGISYDLVTIHSEPSPEIIDEAVRKFSGKEINLVIGIGGGSVLDAGKAISAMMYNHLPIINFLEGVGTREHAGTKIPFIAVPTTSGTGSEATKNAVISKVGEKGFKRSLRHDNFVPEIALVDPELTLLCPADITGASGMDCFTQLTEAFLSDNSNPYTDALAIEGLKSIKTSLLGSYTNGDDIQTRAGMSFAALTSGICLANAGLGVVHGFASSVGGMFDIPHGILCGTLMASANEINIRELRKARAKSLALKKYAVLGKLFLNDESKGDDFYIDGFINFLYQLITDLKLPGLRGYGIDENIIPIICDKTETKNNPVNLTTENLKEILKKRL
jgi:alcohol dehydrogenase class IV